MYLLFKEKWFCKMYTTNLGIVYFKYKTMLQNGDILDWQRNSLHDFVGKVRNTIRSIRIGGIP